MSEILNELEELFDELDQAETHAGRIREKLVDKDNRRALEQIQRLTQDAMEIVEDLM